MKKWKLLSSKLAFNNRWFSVRQDRVSLPNGKVIDDYFVYPEGRVSLIVPITEKNEFVLVKQYKHAAQEILIEFPAGYVDQTEDPQDAAKRELQEETGYAAPQFTLLTKITHIPTKVESEVFIYLATDAVKTQNVSFDENEDIEVIVKPYKEVLTMIENGEIRVSGTIAAAFLACKKLNLPL